MKKIIAIFCLVVTSAVLLPLNNTNAHGEDGLTVAGTVDGYTGDVDYAYKVITAGEPGRFTFNLFEGDVVDVAGTGVEYDDVWVRIMQKNESKIGKTIFAGPILKPVFGGTGMTLTLSEAGEYTIIVRYNKDDTKIVEIPYDITVYSPEVEQKFAFNLDLFIGLATGFFAGIFLPLLFFVFRKLRKSNQKEETNTN